MNLEHLIVPVNKKVLKKKKKKNNPTMMRHVKGVWELIERVWNGQRRNNVSNRIIKVLMDNKPKYKTMSPY